MRRILMEAGFQGTEVDPRDFELDIACGKGIDEALETAVGMGPASRALEGQPPELRAAVIESVRQVLQPYQRGQNVPLAAAIWLVTARNP
ncbi:MAG TPA: hypothetical protein VKE94_13780 [Gemmataceae bacterium]|nr:hypothetical protein [Gemmataceae bacterium]